MFDMRGLGRWWPAGINQDSFLEKGPRQALESGLSDEKGGSCRYLGTKNNKKATALLGDTTECLPGAQTQENLLGACFLLSMSLLLF